MKNLDLTNISIETFYSSFDYIRSIFGNKESFHAYTYLFENDIENKTDIYFIAQSKRINEYQIETFKKFYNSFDIKEL